jgi:hypothetical protein
MIFKKKQKKLRCIGAFFMALPSYTKPLYYSGLPLTVVKQCLLRRAMIEQGALRAGRGRPRRTVLSFGLQCSQCPQAVPPCLQAQSLIYR